MTEQDKKRIGKFLSLVLRHYPQKSCNCLFHTGYVPGF
jgi:RNA:NAD 2'-phosphotransferase (TPT1/KptA family)